jgi:hypothetical protein
MVYNGKREGAMAIKSIGKFLSKIYPNYALVESCNFAIIFFTDLSIDK